MNSARAGQKRFRIRGIAASKDEIRCNTSILDCRYKKLTRLSEGPPQNAPNLNWSKNSGGDASSLYFVMLARFSYDPSA